MKRLRLLLAALALLVISVQVAQAQVKLGDNPGQIDANALLELESTTKGFLLPRMSTVQRLAMPSPAEGMMVYDLTANCTYIYRASAGQWYSLCAADSLTASNGLTKVGRDIQLGGTLNQVTGINQNGNNLNITGNGSLGIGTNSPNANTRVDIAPNSGTDDPLRLQGLRSGASTDSIMTVNAATGILKKRTLADVLRDQDEYVWKLDGNLTTAVRTLGTKSNFALPIITNNVERMRISATGEVGIGTSSPTNKLTVEDAADPLKLVGLQTAAMTDSLLTINPVTGVVRKITIDSVASRGIVAENGINKQGNTVRLGGALNRSTTITTDATNTLNVAGLQGATANDSVVMSDATTGALRRMKLSDVGANSVTANNALTKTGNNIQFGGALVQATSVGTSGTNTLAITGLQGGSANDSVIVQNASTGVLNKMTMADVAAAGITANNGITKTANNVALGGSLVSATTITTSGTNTLALAGLQGGATTDSIVTADAATGVLKRRDVAAVVAAGIEVENGISKTNNKIRLGGALNQATTLTTDATNTLAVAGLQSASANDSVVLAGAADGVLRRMKLSDVGANSITANNGLTKTGNNIQLGGTLVQATTVAQGGNTMAFTGGTVGVGTTAPTATFHVAGSTAMPISTKTGAYTVTIDDHTIIGDCTSGGFTLTLPAASSCAGRTYIIIKGDASNNVLTFSSPINLSTTQSMSSVNYNVRLHIQSDGTNWWLIARF
ncbi:MAG: hypothetical protein JNL70_02570 [Saprospiraceae bacterium]|nr:hypothetical protein [Saprospiraceae bacterium]